MTAIVNNDGSIVEDSISKSEAHPLPELYKSCSRDIKNVAYAVAKATDDPDAKKYAKLLDNITIRGNDLGAIQGGAVEGRLTDYMDRHGLSAVPHEEPTEYEQQQLNEHNVFDELSGKTWWEKPEHIQTPISKSGDKLPVFVQSNEEDGGDDGVYTFEEAKEILQDTLNRIEGVDGNEVVNDSEEDVEVESSDNQSGSDPQEDFFLSEIDKVGPATSENIRQYLVENKETLDWREHIAPESDEWRTTIITKEEARERLQSVALEMDGDDFQKAMQKIEEGNTDQAIMAIEQYE